MSKKHKRQQMQSSYQPSPHQGGLSHTAEYQIIKFDLVKVLALNIVYLAVIISLYYMNKQSGALDTWFAKLLHF